MDDVQKGRQAASVLENPAFREVCEGVNEGLRKAFLGDDDEAALKARFEAKALESVITKLTRMQERGAYLAKKAREEAA